MGALSRRKGAAYERHVATRLRDLYPNAERGLGQARAGHECADVEGCPLWLQTKHGQRPNILAALEQGERDARAANDGRPVAAIVRRNGGQDVIAMHLDDFLALVKGGRDVADG